MRFTLHGLWNLKFPGGAGQSTLFSWSRNLVTMPLRNNLLFCHTVSSAQKPLRAVYGCGICSCLTTLSTLYISQVNVLGRRSWKWDRLILWHPSAGWQHRNHPLLFFFFLEYLPHNCKIVLFIKCSVYKETMLPSKDRFHSKRYLRCLYYQNGSFFHLMQCSSSDAASLMQNVIGLKTRKPDLIFQVGVAENCSKCNQVVWTAAFTSPR